MITDINQIKKRFNEYSPNSSLFKTNLTNKDLNRLNFKLPQNFEEFILKYNLSLLEIFYFFFRNTTKDTNYIDYLLKNNSQHVNPFFEYFSQNNLIIIGNYEQDNLVLNLINGEILRFEIHRQELNKISNNIYELIIILGNLLNIVYSKMSLIEKEEKFKIVLQNLNLEINSFWKLVIAELILSS